MEAKYLIALRSINSIQFFTAVMMFFSCSLVVANEHGGGEAAAPAAEHGGAAAGNEAGSSKSRPNQKPRGQKNFEEWLDLSNKLEKFATRVQAKKQTIEDLLIEKSKVKEPDKLAELIKELNKSHHEYVDMINEYNSLKSFVVYRFPERANDQKRNYKRIETQSLDDLDRELTLDSKVRKILHKMSFQYEPVKGAPDKKTDEFDAAAGALKRRPASTPEITDTIIINK